MDDGDHNATMAIDGVQSSLQPLSIPQACHGLWVVFGRRRQGLGMM